MSEPRQAEKAKGDEPSAGGEEKASGSPEPAAADGEKNRFYPVQYALWAEPNVEARDQEGPNVSGPDLRKTRVLSQIRLATPLAPHPDPAPS